MIEMDPIAALLQADMALKGSESARATFIHVEDTVFVDNCWIKCDDSAPWEYSRANDGVAWMPDE